MKLKTIATAVLSLAGLLATMQLQASEFDSYLQQKKIINEKFKIQDKKSLNELLAVLSAEDSRTLPLQIDQNTHIETLHLTADRTTLEGLITTPDFAQFEQDLGKKEIKKLIERNLVQNCAIFFEHQYQRTNPYTVSLTLRSENQSYNVELKQKDCK